MALPFWLTTVVAAALRFSRNECGNYALVFAVAVVPVTGSVAAAVDYSIMTRIKGELQEAVDASVLAAASAFAIDYQANSLAKIGDDYFRANFEAPEDIDTPAYTLTIGPSADINSTGESTGLALIAEAKTNYTLHFGSFVGLESTKIGARAMVNLSSATLETAFILDASGSMTDNDAFQKSTNAAHDMLLMLKQYALEMKIATKSDTAFAKYALIPFAWGANVGSASKNATWLDQNGWADHHHDQFDWTQGYPATAVASGWKASNKWLTRSTALTEIADSWQGCVEARAYPHFLTDAASSDLVPGTLFVRHFYPDEPDMFGGSEKNFPNNYAEDNIAGAGAGSTIAINGSNSGNETKQRERQFWTSKYNKFSLVADYAKDGLGPNRNCFGFEIVPLNEQFGLTNSYISNLNVTFSDAHTIGSGANDGSTNIQQGLVWGWHVLSSTLPYSEGRPETDVNNRKVAILITDGVNSYGTNGTANGSEYGAFGFLADDRLDEGLSNPGSMTTRQKMDAHTLSTCTNMRNAGIELYVIGYGVAAGSYEESFLKQCAGGDRSIQYYHTVDDSNLTATIETIRNSLIDIRLAS